MEIRAVTPSYFNVMGIPVRGGRSFHDSDTESSPPVILVNETPAHQWWPNRNPIHDRIVIVRFQGRDFGRPTAREVVALLPAGGSRKSKTRSRCPSMDLDQAVRGIAEAT